MVTVAEFNRAQRAKSEPTQQQQNQYQQMAQSMADAGIRSLSGRTTDTERGSRARDIQRDFLADKTGPGGGTTPVEDFMLDPLDFKSDTAGLTETEGDPLKRSIVSNILRGKQPRETGIFGIDFSNVGLPAVGPFFGAIQGLGSTDTFFKNLATKGAEGLSSKDKVILVNLVNRLGTSPESIENLLQTYADKNEVSADVLASDFNKAYNKIGSDVLSSGIIDYFDTKPEGLKESLSAMAGQFEGDKVPGQVLGLDEYGDIVPVSGMVDRPTLQDVTSKLGTEGLQFLKVTNPQAYYALRPNDPDLANESFVSTGDRVADRRFNAKIMEARAEAMDRQSRQDANMAQASPAFAPPTAPAPGTPAPPPAPPIFPGFPVTPTPTPPGTPTTPVATNYSNLPTYTQLGIPTFLGDPRFAQFRDTLNLFPRV
jgi:hypothetical protein